jgi:predicted AlkP superfamily pyrophosphatase or phosphodiesterase
MPKAKSIALKVFQENPDWFFLFGKSGMKKILALYIFISPVFLFAQENINHDLQDTSQHIVQGRTNRPVQMKKSYIILISADGFRYDLADKYQATNLLSLRESGVSADHMQSVFPSLTFPNHYSIITGDYPDHDGIVDNTFYDPSRKLIYSMSNRKMVDDSSWYGATPLWVLAEKQGMLTASFYWVGAESSIQGVRPTYYYKFNSLIPMKKRIEGVRDWLLLPEEKRPHLINFYIPDVDHQEHMYGVGSRQTEEAVHYVDNAIAGLVRTVDSLHLPVNYIFVSDHGMTDLDTVNVLTLPEKMDTSKFIITSSLSLVHIYAKKKSDILPAYTFLKSVSKGYDVYLTTNTPARWHYNKINDRYNRIGDILLVARPPKAFKLASRRLPAATHGFDPAIPDMYATFYAWGPAFRKNLKIRGFENIHIYPLITEILQLKIAEPVDGSLKILRPILK